MQYTIKQAAEKTGLKEHVLRYYEKEGLLPSVQRSQSGMRRYSQDDLEWLGLICCLKNTGMSIKQIRDFVHLSLQGEHTLNARCEMLKDHKRQVEREMRETQKHLEKVAHKIEYFSKQHQQYLQERKTPVKPGHDRETGLTSCSREGL